MHTSRTLISCLIIALILHPSLAQDPSSNPTASPNSIPATPLSPSETHPPNPDPNPSLTAQNTETSNPSTTEAQPSNAVPASVQAQGSKPHQIPAPNIQIQTVAATPHNEKAQQGGYQNRMNPNPEDATMKEAIKKMIADMTQQELEAFQKQLSGDARHYYDQLLKEQTERYAAEQKWEEQELHEMEQEGQLSQSDTQRRKQTAQFNDQWDKIADRQISFHQYLFELGKGSSEDFRFTIPVSQQVTFYGYTYENQDGVYSVPSNIEDQQPIWVYVYENNHRIVFQKQFYFKYIGSFPGAQNSSYIVRFVNPTKEKLIAFNLGILFEIGHSADKLTAIDVADHSRRVKETRTEVVNRFHDAHTREVFAGQNREELTVKLERYYAYSIVEILIIAVLCVMQVEFVRKLLASSSVV